MHLSLVWPKTIKNLDASSFFGRSLVEFLYDLRKVGWVGRTAGSESSGGLASAIGHGAPPKAGRESRGTERAVTVGPRAYAGRLTPCGLVELIDRIFDLFGIGRTGFGEEELEKKDG